MASIFSKIIAGEIPCYKVAENEFCLAFLDVSPLTEGHVLVVPKKEVDLLFDLDDDYYQQVGMMAKKVAKGLKKVIPCTRIGMAVIGLEVPHAHVHLVPINNIGDIDFTKKRVEFSEEEFQKTSEMIKNVL